MDTVIIGAGGHGKVVLDTTRAVYLWELPNFPQYYIPLDDVAADVLVDELAGRGVVGEQALALATTRENKDYLPGHRLDDSIQIGLEPLPALMEAFETKVAATLARLDEEAAALEKAPFTIGTVAIACALGYMDFRFPQVDWRTPHPNLARLYDKLMQRQSFIDTRPA